MRQSPTRVAATCQSAREFTRDLPFPCGERKRQFREPSVMFPNHPRTGVRRIDADQAWARIRRKGADRAGARFAYPHALPLRRVRRDRYNKTSGLFLPCPGRASFSFDGRWVLVYSVRLSAPRWSRLPCAFYSSMILQHRTAWRANSFCAPPPARNSVGSCYPLFQLRRPGVPLERLQPVVVRPDQVDPPRAEAENPGAGRQADHAAQGAVTIEDIHARGGLA